jgi:hypothetical protein
MRKNWRSGAERAATHQLELGHTCSTIRRFEERKSDSHSMNSSSFTPAYQIHTLQARQLPHCHHPRVACNSNVLPGRQPRSLRLLQATARRPTAPPRLPPRLHRRCIPLSAVCHHNENHASELCAVGNTGGTLRTCEPKKCSVVAGVKGWMAGRNCG